MPKKIYFSERRGPAKVGDHFERISDGRKFVIAKVNHTREFGKPKVFYMVRDVVTGYTFPTDARFLEMDCWYIV